MTHEEYAEKLFLEKKYPTSFQTLRKAFIANAKRYKIQYRKRQDIQGEGEE